MSNFLRVKMMKFNSNKLNERIDFCEDVSERGTETDETEDENIILFVSLAFKNLKNPTLKRISIQVANSLNYYYQRYMR